VVAGEFKHYDKADLETFIRRTGGVVVDQLGPGCDYLVAGDRSDRQQADARSRPARPPRPRPPAATTARPRPRPPTRAQPRPRRPTPGLPRRRPTPSKARAQRAAALAASRG
jgi:hypothetical protein